ncbi:CLUMA_CG014223, isoform A [Clunio marinus]|uniref:CLUMA_CG014223, isoform A n=1 Tax=Clunio marinus TaxID=568069 RepID=A0A1J1ILA8_9DIPT|nr:CLUMA_CG014223, isoform A [Clunio marinus]
MRANLRSNIAEERKNTGNAEYKAQNYHAALKYYSDAVNLCPDNPSYLGNRSACHMMLANYREALNDARKSIQIDPTFEKGYLRVAKCCLLLGDLTQTEQTIKRFLEIDPKNTVLKSEIQNLRQLRIHEDKASQCYEKQDYRTCLFHIDSALKTAQASQRYKLLKAECLALLGRMDEANDIAIGIMKIDSNNCDAIYVRGLTLYYSDNLEKGILHFERTLQLDPDHKKAKIMRLKSRNLKEKKEQGNECFKTGKYREALVIYSDALSIDSLNKEINSKLYYNRALVNTKLGNLRDAINDCSAALKINEKYVKALLKRARCQYDMENFEESVKDYEAALKMDKSIETKNALKDAKLQLKKSKRKDYYKILGITKSATEDEIKKAYRKRALIHHPDRHANATEEEKKEEEKKFKEVGEAYTILSDPVKKSRYDNGQDLEEMEMPEFDPNQMFRQFFSFNTDTGGGFGGGNSFSFHFGKCGETIHSILIMNINLSESENRYYNDLFTLCDVEKIGKIEFLKATEFFRSSNVDNSILSQIYQLAGVFPTVIYLSRTQFYSCLKLIGAHQAMIPLREEILTSTTVQIPLPKFSWNLELEPPPQIVSATLKSEQNGITLPQSPDLIELTTKESHHLEVERNLNSDLPSTDSEIEQTDNERELPVRRRSGAGVTLIKKNKRDGSPETWSTASESPTPTNTAHNSVAERPWAMNSQSWQGLLCEEQRQLLGTEEESSDKHTSDEDEDDLDLDALYQITPEQKDYYLKQFRTVQPDIKGLLSGVVARVFFEKSRIPVEELRHIWQLCDVSRDGALDLGEFTAAMHLVVLRRNNIPIPSTLPICLQPDYLYKCLGLPHQEPSAEADLLHLESDDNQDSSKNQSTSNANKNDYQRMVSSTYEEFRSSEKSNSIINKSSTLPKNHYSQHQRGAGDDESLSCVNNNVNNNNSLKLNNVIGTNHSSSNSPPSQTVTADGPGDSHTANKEWTKFTESPTSNVSSPGPKPVNVTTNIIDPSHVIHPVPLRVTPVGTEIVDDDAQKTFRKADSLVFESGVIKAVASLAANDRESVSPKQNNFKKQSSYANQRESLPNDLRAIQRPHPKKPASKMVGAIPLPPEINHNNNNNHTSNISSNNITTNTGNNSNIIVLTAKKEIPPLPPPRPHRHTRSSSLDLQRIKLVNNESHEKKEKSAQPPEIPPPRISDKNFKMSSVDAYLEASRRTDESFADFTQFPEEKQPGEFVTTIRLESNPPPVLQPRSNLTSTLLSSTQSGTHRSSAFEVYRKPSKSRNSQSPTSNALSANEQSKTQEYEKEVLEISDNLRQIRLRNTSDQDVLKHLKNQNFVLMQLCKNLNDELMNVQKKKEEICNRMETN